MFEDSTFESTGRIKTRSRRWMFATLIFNGSILVTLILLPLIYPDALPNHGLISLIVAPEAPKPETPPKPIRIQPAQAHNYSELDQERMIAPAIIPRTPFVPVAPELLFHADNIGGDNGPGVIGGTGNGIFNGHSAVVVRTPATGPVRLSSSFVEGFLIYKNVPQYPIIAKTMGVQGTVVLQAVISKSGTIDNLRVVSGPPVLQQAAIDAVKSWRYRPYLLNQQPVEVETTVNVIFKLDR
jgi:protein TonB